MSSINSTSKSTSKHLGIKEKKHPMQKLLNYGTVVVFILIVFGIYKLFIVKNYQRLRVEGFEDTIPDTSSNTNKDTIYEKSIKNIYSNNTRLLCSMLPNIYNSSNVCKVNNEIFVPYNFPVHIIKINDGTILAVFNDGRLYRKDSMISTLWIGPITNSMPNNTIPMRMVTLSKDLVTLLGVGFDNILYIKKPKVNGNINLTGPWVQVPNNSSIIYVLFDAATGYMISIDVDGNLFTKTTVDITSNNQQLITKLDRPILRLYYDLNGYMLVIDNDFDLYQFTEIDWKNSPLNLGRGANSSKIQDLLYDNDGKMYGLVFNNDSFMVQIMKQTTTFYLAEFIPLESHITSENNANFVLSDQDIMKYKIGNISDYLNTANADDENDDDPNFAYQKQTIENQSKLREFCSNRNMISSDSNYDNYELLSSVDKNNSKIKNLKEIINNLLSYEPDGDNIREKYPIISQ
jgi:hypothetical protein